MKFDDLLAEVTALLQHQGRVSYRALKRRYELTDDDIEDLKAELIDARRLATDEDGRVLVWRQSDLGPEQPTAVSETEPDTAVIASREARSTADEAERRQLTVMFCDLADSTSLSGRLDPEDLRELIRAYQQAACAVIQRFDGHVAQYLGDGVLVYFGYPSAHEDDALRAVSAGLGILASLDELNANLQSRYGVRVALRIGVHTGVVVVGDVGGGRRHERLALGEAPNVAARIQGLAAPNTLLVSERTRHLLHGAFELEDLGTQQLKGVTEPMRAYRVHRESAVESRFDAATTGGLTALVGRDAELSLLAKRWEDAKTGEGQVVVLIGEPGIGKSRLTDALRHRIAADSHTSLRYQCSPYYASSAFHPFIVQLERAAHFEADNTSAQKLAKLEEILSQAAPSGHDAMPLFAAMLSLPIDGRYRPLTLSPEKQRAKTIEALGDQLVGLAGRQPVFLTFEDAHWADPTSVDVLTHIVPRIADHRVLVVITCRPEFVPPWSVGAHVTSLSLQRLSRAEVTLFIGRVAGKTLLPRAIVTEIVTKTDGVPLYIEELTKSMLESGLAGAEASASANVPLAAIPATLQDALMARLDRLAPVREIAQIGAAIGRDFSHEMLAAVARMPAQELESGLDKLVDAELLVRRGQPPDAQYRFKHALIRDAAYATLLRSQRHQLHAQIAAVIKEQVPAVVTTTPEILAHHYAEAGLNAQAIPYWQDAGQRANQRSAYAEALSHLTKGLELLKTLPDAPERAEFELKLQVALGTSLIATRGYGAPEVGQALGRARELCRQVGDTPQLFPVLWGLGAFYSVRDELQTARELAEQLLDLTQSVEDPVLRTGAAYLAGVPSFLLGDLTGAREQFERGIALYDRRQHRSSIPVFGEDFGVSCRCWAAFALWSLGYPEQALNRSQEALTLAQEFSHPVSLGYAVGSAARVHYFRREVSATQAHAEKLLELAAEQGFGLRVAQMTIQRAWALAMQGQGEEGITQMRQGLAALHATGAEFLRSGYLAQLAEAYGIVNRPAEGISVLAEALDMVSRTGERVFEAELYRLKGQLTLQQFQVSGMKFRAQENRDSEAWNPESEAEEYFLKAIEIARNQEARLPELRATVSLSRLWQSQGRRVEAHRLLSRIYGWFTEGFDTADLQDAKSLLEGLSASRDASSSIGTTC